MDKKRSGSISSSLTLGDVWATLAVLVPVILVLAGDVGTIDAAYMIRAGEEMLISRDLPGQDTFTFTAEGMPWTNQQWGGHVLFALVYRIGGWELLGLLRALLVGVAFYALYRACRTAGASQRRAAALTLAGCAVALPQLGVRPQLFAIALFTLSLLIVTARHEHPRRLWALVPLMLLWVNLHGTFFLLPCIVALACIDDLTRGRSIRSLATVGASVLATTLLNPYGFEVWRYVGSLSQDPDVVHAVSEWAAPDIRNFAGAVFFASVGAVLVLLARRPERTPWGLLAWLTFFLALALYTERATIWWALALPPLLAATQENRSSNDPTEPRRPINAAIVALLVGIALLLLPWWRAVVIDRPLLAVTPGSLTDRLDQVTDPGDRIFNAQMWGSWLELALPDNPVFIDSRIELFPAHVWDDYRAISQAREGWQDTLARWEVDAAIISREQQEHLIGPMERDPDWELVASDALGLVFVRTAP